MLIPGFEEIKKAALDAGALGCSISGSGPTIFALSNDAATAKKACKAMADVFKSLKLDTDIHISKINKNGPRVL